MVSSKELNRAAEMLRSAQNSRIPCKPVRDIIGAKDLESAYEVQRINNEHRLAAGEVAVGAKIGLTSEAVQKQLGVDQPDYGLLTASMQLKQGDVLPFDELIQPKAEVEVAFLVGQDLPDRTLKREEVEAYLKEAFLSIEIVGSRVENWDIRISDTIADNASASHFVISNQGRRITDLDLEACKMQLFRNGELVSSGVGSACLGNPLNATLWLINKWQELGNPLKKDQWILAGALGPMAPIAPGDEFKASIDGLGELVLNVSEEE